MPGRFAHLLVTGGCGFIGSNFVRHVLSRETALHVTNLDLLVYSGNEENLADVVAGQPAGGGARYRFVKGDICDEETVSRIFTDSLSSRNRPPVDAVVHFAAESHVDRSIIDPTAFARTNVLGTAKLVECARIMRDALPPHFRFLHVSTDEVYGSLGPSAPPFSEDSPIAPNSPYAASKAGSDMVVRAYIQTYDFPALITRCSNNYGPFQYPEKLIPLMITNAMRDARLPVYGDGLNIRDWIHVDDHCAALWSVLNDGGLGTCYNIGGESEVTNLDIVKGILRALGKPESLIAFVKDRPGHDRRYAMNIGRIRGETGWRPVVPFDAGIQSTIEWYRRHEGWWRPLLGESQRIAKSVYKA